MENDFNKTQVMSMMKASLDTNMNFNVGDALPKSNNNASMMTTNLNATHANYVGDPILRNASNNMTCYGYWRDYYYPNVIRESYPVYIQERALDKGKQAFEIIKMLQDKKLVKLEKVSDFIEAMDELIKIL